jgi:hypothetical protein
MVTGAIAAIIAVASPRPTISPTDELFVIDPTLGPTDPIRLLRVQMSLSDVRSALIGRAAMANDRPGSLPCPDTNNDGIAEPPAGGVCGSYIGRLPWQDLGLPDLRDSSGERLWYALSPSLRDDGSAQPINSDTVAQLSVTGAMPQTNVAAVIIAPGQALAGQVRDVAGLNNPLNYLEGENANGDTIYHTASATSAFNDRVDAITRDQLFAAVEGRVAREIRDVLRKYYVSKGYYPFANDYGLGTFACTNGQTRGRVPNPNPLAPDISSTCPPPSPPPNSSDWGGAPSIPPPAWFFNNAWHLLTYYSLAPACTSATPTCSGAGFLTVNGTGGHHAIVIVGSRALGTQVRPCALAADCIEQPSAGLDQYMMQARTNTYNDRVIVVAP